MDEEERHKRQRGAEEEQRPRSVAALEAELRESQRAAEEFRQRAERAEEERRRSEEKAEEQQQRAEEERQRDVEQLSRSLEELSLLVVKQQQRAEEYRRETSILRGNYYATIDQVWKGAANTYDDWSYFDQLKRQSAPSFYTRSAVATTQGPNVYSLTVDAARAEDYEPAFDATRSKHSGSSNTNNKDTIFNKDIFGNDEHVGQPLAHLIPHSKDHATLYVDVAIWALGLDESATPSNWQMWQKAIHGAKKTNQNRRTDHTGIKHFVANVICLSSQGDFFDFNPTVFIIPVMSEEEMKTWCGTGYSAIVVVGSKTFERRDRNKTVHSNVVCQAIRMTNEGPLAAPDDIEKARILLGKVICGMAYWLTHMSKHIEDNLDDGAKEELQKLRQKFTSITGEGVVVPVPNQDPSQLKVRLVTFSDHNDPEGGHPSPDPLLLAAKAARNFTSFHDQHLKAAAEPQEEEWEKDELQQLAFEEYLDYCRNSYRPKTREDLARGLGQPFGYQQVQDEESKL